MNIKHLRYVTDEIIFSKDYREVARAPVYSNGKDSYFVLPTFYDYCDLKDKGLLEFSSVISQHVCYMISHKKFEVGHSREKLDGR